MSLLPAGLRPRLSLLLPTVLLACAVPESATDVTPRWAGVPRSTQYDFAWRLSGQREVAPWQVFDDGQDTWLQFAPGQAVPAIFALEDGQERLLSYERTGPYIRVAGRWPALRFRGGHQQAMAQYQGAARPSLAPAAASAPQVEGALPLHLAGAASDQIPPAAVTSPPEVAPVMAGYAASMADGTMRQVLARWAQRAGWTFDAWHWTVDIDVPLAGDAVFGDDFVQAVRELVAATELSGQPLQPCFYSNKVLRVVPWAQPCDRQPGGSGAPI